MKNDGYSYAADILDQNNLVIISGIPGIGKTTLAKILIWEYLKQGYEIIEIRSVNEGENILREGDRHKQILYFDDFLGENFLAFDVLQGRSNDLYMFMKRFAERNAKSKKLIMTTREYILNQAFIKYEKLNAQDLNVNKYILDLTKYSINSKALILYNHLYYSNLPMEYIRNILTDNNYEKIIYHRNYSPRIIEAMTIKVGDLRSNEYTKEFLNSLDNPLRIWEHAFESQISEAAQYLLYLLVSFGTDILVKDLEIAFRDFTTKAGLISQLQTNHNSFRNHLKELQDTFIKVNITQYHEHRAEFMNPSVRDFLINRISENAQILSYLVKSSRYFGQLLYLHSNFIKGKHDDIVEIVETRIIEYWDQFQSSRLLQWHGQENSWHVHHFDDFEKLYHLSQDFNLKHRSKLWDLLVSGFILHPIKTGQEIRE